MTQDNPPNQLAQPNGSSPSSSETTWPLTQGVSLGMLLKGRYLIERELGRGGMGVAYLARDQQLHSRPVVIKVLLEKSDHYLWLKTKFRDEIKALARINHPGVVGVFDAGEMPDGTPYVVMEFVEGVTLRSALKKESMDFQRVAHITRQASHALTAAHNKEVCHCDLKPENIMLQNLGEGEEMVKLIDFGLAKVTDARMATSTDIKGFAGTIPYMAPEQLQGTPSPLSDIYALGVIAYEMLTGQRPYNPDSLSQLLEMQQAGVRLKPKDLRANLPESAQEAILKALSFDPKDRYARARDFGEELARALSTHANARAPDRGQPPTLEIAHVLSMDLVDSSELPVDQQAQLLHKLQEIVGGTAEFRLAQASQQIVQLSTGEGHGLVFFGDPAAPARCAMEIWSALRSYPEMKLRMGLHSGAVYRVQDSSTSTGENVIGSGIRIAHSVRSYGDPGHILLSKTIAEVLKQLSHWVDYLHPLGEGKVESGSYIQLFNLHKGELGNPEIPSKLRTYARRVHTLARSEPNLGRLVSKMCNRRTQEDEFKNFFFSNIHQHPGWPQLYIVPGEEGECHDSMVERFLYQVELFAQERYGQDKGTLNFKRIPWQYEGPVDTRRDRLLFWLFEQFAPSDRLLLRDLSATAFRNIISPLLNAFIVIQHDIRAARWDRLAAELIRSYLQFWAELKDVPSKPQILVFLNLIYPATSPNHRWKLWSLPGLLLRKIKRKGIQNEVRAICGLSCSCLMLNELGPITWDDVMEWFSLHNIYDSEELRLKASERIFKTGGRSSGQKIMAEIELYLRDIHKEFVTSRGYL